MSRERKDTGDRGEAQAASYLEGLGHRILERNWRWGHLEVDIISLSPGGLHIVEVKTRRLPAPAQPERNVDARKQANLTKAAKAYLSRGGAPAGSEVFFDVVAVEYAPDGDCSLQYYPQAFIPMYI